MQVVTCHVASYAYGALLWTLSDVVSGNAHRLIFQLFLYLYSVVLQFAR